MKKQVMVYSKLECQECGSNLNIPRKRAKKRSEGHIKHMYCPTCKLTTGFIETNKDKSYDFWEQWHKQFN